MGHRIENPSEWEGHEVEAMLATHSGREIDKELCIVSVVRREGPVSFYRVKEAGENPADFEDWLEAVDYYNCIGEEVLCEISGEVCKYKPGKDKERPCKTLCSTGKEWFRKGRGFKAEKLLEEGSSLKREVGILISDCLLGLPLEGRTLTVRQEYEPKMGGKWIKIPPQDGEGIKAVKKAIEEKWGLVPEKDFKAYSKEEEGDKILYLEFAGALRTITLEVDIFESWRRI